VIGYSSVAMILHSPEERTTLDPIDVLRILSNLWSIWQDKGKTTLFHLKYNAAF
jgi:hypothetical protein